MKMFVGGEWVGKDARAEVTNPFDGRVLDTVPMADATDVDRALAMAEEGAPVMAAVPAYERHGMLSRTAALMRERAEDLAQIISSEEGKAIAEARGEVQRSIQTMTLSAEEAKRLYGETIPLDAAPGGAGKFGLSIRVPVGVVVAIAPFNYPLNLVCHKVGPALAAGNAVIVKPASDTPLSALKLTEILLEAAVPPQGIQCITGSGSTVGGALVADPRVRKVSFTGSRDVGEAICRRAGLKKVTMELGSNSPLIVMPDADIQKVAEATARTGYTNAGQVCISTQRVLVDGTVYGDFLDAAAPLVRDITLGDQLDEANVMGPMVRTSDAERVAAWIQDAVASGARIVAGGQRDGTLHAATLIADVEPGMRISRDELFGPAVAVTRFDTIDEAIDLANSTNYGLSAGIFTENINWAMEFVRRVHSGNLHVNWGPQWRVDLMPYGGLKESGMGKEGPRYAIEEMTETKMVVFH